MICGAGRYMIPAMDTAFVLRLAASFLVAGTWISLATLAAEKLGSRLGGLIGNLPSNIVVSLIFVSLTKGPHFAAEAARAVPLGMAIDTVFLFTFVAAAGLGPLRAAPLALLAWAAGAGLALALPPLPMLASVAVFVIVAGGLFLVAEGPLRIRAVPKRDSHFRPAALALRAVFAGSVVATTVATASFAPPYLTGLIATFPAVLLSTMTILSLAQGPDFARATGKILLLSSSNIVVYALVAQLSFPAVGWLAGSLLSFLAAAAWVALLRPLLAKAG
ncbi:MAG: hypothetical protein A2Y37_10285 [Spirochaetes bacterium GWB1_60_80]|nr:MAG: hypothetical protein A2Y37_10285 [Spirochaetes bacterium GWB1_60_80]OHD43420.1 MAG: hypothetical protein A2Y35_11655 [Spirochaetes bacterium GWE1_60_18]OHD58951.1 MAG: hypothetical protein A2Y32_10445 [Spirochaetes bacterium GWF1_60_12]HAP42630.1 hypothetical protein [Spirochaetaceae bacterium]HAW85274.1 hypothetical protein [Spirochaetaceae bacterium]